jgi:hypothetical protein
VENRFDLQVTHSITAVDCRNITDEEGQEMFDGLLL